MKIKPSDAAAAAVGRISGDPADPANPDPNQAVVDVLKTSRNVTKAAASKIAEGLNKDRATIQNPTIGEPTLVTDPVDPVIDPAPAADLEPVDPTPAVDPASDPVDPVQREPEEWEKDFLKTVEGDPVDPAADLIDPNANPTDNPEVQELQTKYKEVTEKLRKQEEILSNPLVSALAEFVASGNDDISAFVKEVGGYDPRSMTIEDMYREVAREQGIAEEDIENAVSEQMEEYGNLTTIKRKEEENRLKSQFAGKSNQKLKTLTDKMAADRMQKDQHIAEISNRAEANLEEQLTGLIGKRWKTLEVDTEMANQIRQALPAFAPNIAKFDENGNLTDFDVKEGIKMAMWSLYEDKLLATTFKFGKTKGYEEAIIERSRPSSAAPAANPVVPSAKSKSEKVDEAVKNVASKNGAGRKSLFSLDKP